MTPLTAFAGVRLRWPAMMRLTCIGILAQFALLLPGEREHGLRVVAVQLDQGERLQHAIVQVRGHVGTFLFTLLECALGG